jgi:uncharacterized membrane protein
MVRALALFGLAIAVIAWSYLRADSKRSVRFGALLLKTLGIAALVLSLIEPLLAGSRPRQGANNFVILADNSQSLLIRDGDAASTRGDLVRNLLRPEASWRTRLGQDFDVRNYLFDTHLRAVDGFDGLKFDGEGTALATSLVALKKRFQGLPLAGVLLFTDGNRTDPGDVDWTELPPIYPVILPSRGVVKDIGVARVSISQTNFETAPVVVRADVSTTGYRGESIVATVADEAGKVVERQVAESNRDGKPLSFRFQFRPEHRGVSFYQVRAIAASDEKQRERPGEEGSSGEATLANNSRRVVVDSGSGPYRVLYVSGRPNWEYKFLRRALEEDKEVELLGLVRIAVRQPKFDFRSPRDQSMSRLFAGFDHPDAETAERHDESVKIRLGPLGEGELRDGFPKTADLMYRYHAIVLDDIEAGFFTADQQTLVRNFVSQRGGGLLMLGGPDSFADGKYDRTPIGELLPVYLNRLGASADLEDEEHQLALTREGQLQPWVRLRKTEDEERQRLAGMPAFHTISRAGSIKPGATILSEVSDGSGPKVPALVAQSFGKGHVAALLIGDLWRWGMRRENPAQSDLDQSWRQTIRWLVADVPNRVEVSTSPKAGSTSPALELTVRVRDAEYRPLDNAKVAFRVTLPGGDNLNLEAEPDHREAGTYAATYVPKQPGPYRFVATATAPDGSAIGEREAGWAAQPTADEFARLEPDRDFLQMVAARTRGEVVEGTNLAALVASLPARGAPITEPWTAPLWHQPVYFLFAIACLLGEWGLRRVNGLA